MGFEGNIVCPVSREKMDGNVGRLTTGLNVVLMVLFLCTHAALLPPFLLLDYAMRAFTATPSPTAVLAATLAPQLGLQPRLVPKAPKVFAARLGVCCAALASLLVLTGAPLAASYVIAFFATLASLDAAGNFCLGCVIYTYVVLPFFSG